jgi:hypothetical protein
MAGHHLRDTDKNAKPSDGRLLSRTVEGLYYRFLRSQPRVTGPESLRRARPLRSAYHHSTQPKALNIGGDFKHSIRALQTHMI